MTKILFVPDTMRRAPQEQVDKLVNLWRKFGAFDYEESVRSERDPNRRELFDQGINWRDPFLRRYLRIDRCSTLDSPFRRVLRISVNNTGAMLAALHHLTQKKRWKADVTPCADEVTDHKIAYHLIDRIWQAPCSRPKRNLEDDTGVADDIASYYGLASGLVIEGSEREERVLDSAYRMALAYIINLYEWPFALMVNEDNGDPCIYVTADITQLALIMRAVIRCAPLMNSLLDELEGSRDHEGMDHTLVERCEAMVTQRWIAKRAERSQGPDARLAGYQGAGGAECMGRILAPFTEIRERHLKRDMTQTLQDLSRIEYEQVKD
jgi:hypothetical protein